MPPTGSRAHPPAPRRAWGTGEMLETSSAVQHHSSHAPNDILERRAEVAAPRAIDAVTMAAMVPGLAHSLAAPWEPPPEHLGYRHYRALKKNRQALAREGMLPPIAGAVE